MIVIELKLVRVKDIACEFNVNPHESIFLRIIIAMVQIEAIVERKNVIEIDQKKDKTMQLQIF